MRVLIIVDNLPKVPNAWRQDIDNSLWYKYNRFLYNNPEPTARSAVRRGLTNSARLFTPGKKATHAKCKGFINNRGRDGYGSLGDTSSLISKICWTVRSGKGKKQDSKKYVYKDYPTRKKFFFNLPQKE